jgi:hypothetical protein
LALAIGNYIQDRVQEEVEEAGRYKILEGSVAGAHLDTVVSDEFVDNVV